MPLHMTDTKLLLRSNGIKIKSFGRQRLTWATLRISGERLRGDFVDGMASYHIQSILRAAHSADPGAGWS